MKLTRGHWLILIFNLLYIAGFTIFYVSIQNFEFLWYVAVLVFFFVLIASTLHKSKFTYLILWGLSLWGLLHMAGGGIVVGDDVLYALQIIPLVNGANELTLLKYDQIVHAFGFGVATLVVYHLVIPYLNEKTNWTLIYFFLVTAGTGLGVLNEIVEFIAVLTFPETGVGGYYNTALDLVFNTLGAVLAVIVIHFGMRKQKHITQ